MRGMRLSVLFIAFIMILSIFVIPPGTGSHVMAKENGISIQPHAHLLSLASDPSYPVNNSSTIIASPPPQTPNTTPYVLNLVSNFVVHRGGLNKPAPRTFINGTAVPPPMPPQGWALIELVYTGNASGTVYDSGYSLNVNNNTLFWGSSPEYGNWTVYDNLTVYTALFTSSFFWQWNSPGAIVNGTFVTSIKLLFYPADAQYPAPSTPNLMVPILPSMTSGGYQITPTHRTVYGNVTVPADTTAAILQLWVYGFSYDEFWYSNEPSYRDVIVNVSGMPVWSLLPFPYINTGGIDLFSWRPITGVYTLNDRLYMENITAALGLIEGTHEWSFNIPNLLPSWSITASLLLYTNPLALSARLSYYNFTMPVVHTVQTSTSTQETFNQSAQLNYSYASYIYMDDGFELASTSVFENFTNNQTLTAVWENLSGNETTVIRDYTLFHTAFSSLSDYQNIFVYYPLSMDTFFSITITHTTDGGFPEYGNASFGLTNLTQGWIQRSVSLTSHGTYYSLRNSLVANVVNSDKSEVISNLTLISPTAGILGAIYHVQGFTGKRYIAVSSAWPVEYYTHVLQAGSMNLTPPDYIQPLLINLVISGVFAPPVPHPMFSGPVIHREPVIADSYRRGLPVNIM